jgi:hypothetical protein
MLLAAEMDVDDLELGQEEGDGQDGPWDIELLIGHSLSRQRDQVDDERGQRKQGDEHPYPSPSALAGSPEQPAAEAGSGAQVETARRDSTDPDLLARS